VSDYFREPKKVRTRPELEKSCRMLREHNEKLKAHNEVLECEIAMWRKHVVELEATIGRVIPGTPATESDWVKLVGVKEALEATIKRVRECKQYVAELPEIGKLAPVLRWRDVLQALGEAK